VTTALEWSYAAGETDVRAETLEKAAQLLVLRRDTLQIIDGAGPNVLVLERDGAEPASANGTERETVQESEQQNTTETVETAKEQVQTVKSPTQNADPGDFKTLVFSRKNGLGRGWRINDERQEQSPHETFLPLLS
jgi:hypothetical protein